MTRMPVALRRQALRLAEPTPARTRRARAVADRLIRRLAANARQRGLDVRPLLVGSLAKDTHLADPLDIDVFILFDPSTSREDLEKQGVGLARSVVPRPVLRYAEHPYVHGKVEGFQVDVVPAYRLDSPEGRKSAVDRTPFHTEYVRTYATPGLRQEIRLLKRFLRGIGCYGAETSSGGVSGYLAELLVLRFGGFEATLGALASMEAPLRLTLTVEPPDWDGPVQFVDPVDPRRNAAAAVNAATLGRLHQAARAFLQAPTLRFFKPRKARALSARRLADLLAAQPVVGVVAPAPPGRDEARLPQAQRLAAKAARTLEKEGFRIIRHDAVALASGRSVLLLFAHDPPLLPPDVVHDGPPAHAKEHGERFREKWAGHPDALGPPRVEGGRWTVRVRRRVRDPAGILRDRLPTLLEGFDYPAAQRRAARALGPAELPRLASRRLPLSLFLTQRPPWEW